MTNPAGAARPAAEPVRLGLIGDNIAKSQSPRLHRIGGRLIGRPTTYDRLVPPALGRPFEAVFAEAMGSGYRGLNITYPYKERVTALVEVEDERVRRLGAVNTVLFTEHGPRGFNTDFSGFIAAYKRVRGDAATGPVCMVGAGGVGKAVAYGLADLGLVRLAIVERDLAKGEALAAALQEHFPALRVSVTSDVAAAAEGAAGLVNCTPVGMVGYGGTPLPRALMAGAAWAFDAVYTPVDTEFLADAAAEGLTIISGYELFFYQGLHAFEIFHGRAIDEAWLRGALLDPGMEPEPA